MRACVWVCVRSVERMCLAWFMQFGLTDQDIAQVQELMDLKRVTQMGRLDEGKGWLYALVSDMIDGQTDA